MGRKKIVSIRVNEDKYNKFLEIIDKFTTTYQISYPSSERTRYHTQFPDKCFSFDKYSFADLVNDALKEFIEKYKSYV